MYKFIYIYIVYICILMYIIYKLKFKFINAAPCRKEAAGFKERKPKKPSKKGNKCRQA